MKSQKQLEELRAVFEDLCTNDLVDVTLMAIETLKGWAKADAEHNTESDAPSYARLDNARWRRLEKAKFEIKNCYK